MGKRKERCQISPAKEPFLEAIRIVISSLRPFWPISVRHLHYKLLNAPPLRHAKKPDSTYANNPASYKALVDLVSRGRIAFRIPWEAIDDATRPTRLCNTYNSTTPFIERDVNNFLRYYQRDLLQSQPNHVEIVVEKNALLPVVKRVAWEFTMPVTSGRGFCSLPPRKAMADRFVDSGKEKLVFLILSDLDPDGREIASSLPRSMRDDFYIPESKIEAFQASLTLDQVGRYNLVPNMSAKILSPNYTKYVEEYGEDVFELEAIDSADLQQELRNAIEDVIDVDAYNAEIKKEKQDAAKLEAIKKALQPIMLEALAEREKPTDR